MVGYVLNNTHTCSRKAETPATSIFLEWSLDKLNAYVYDKAAQTFSPMPSKHDQ